jgi:alpha-1,6-mannosyltransferase
VPLLPDNLFVPLLDLGKISGYTWLSAALYLLLVLGLYALYAVGYRLVTQGTQATGRTAIFVLGAVFCFELVWAYPATAVDVFGYIAHGRLFAQHHLNPFIFTPNEFPGDAIIPYLAYSDEPSQYGPIWVLLGGALSTLGAGNLVVEILLYKGAGALAHLASAAIVYKIVEALRPDDQACARASAYLYLWNPLLLWEMVGNAHNDGMTMLFGLIAVWLFIRGASRFVIPAVAAGALVKVPVILMAPVFFIGVWHQRRLAAIEGALLGLALASVVYRPFWDGPETLTALRRTDIFTASLGSVLRLSLIPSLGETDAAAVARWISLSTFGAVAAFALMLALRADRSQDILRLAYVTLLAGLLLATTWFQAWYIVWPFALGTVLAEPRRHLEVALLSLGGALQYFVFIYLWVIGVFPQSENLGVQGAAYAAIIGPLVLGVALHSVLVRGESTWKRSLHRASG